MCDQQSNMLGIYDVCEDDAVIKTSYAVHKASLISDEFYEANSFIHSCTKYHIKNEAKICGFWGFDTKGRYKSESLGCGKAYIYSRVIFGRYWEEWQYNGKVFEYLPDQEGNFIDTYFSQKYWQDDSVILSDEILDEIHSTEITRHAVCPHCHAQRKVAVPSGTMVATSPLNDFSLSTFYRRHKYL